MDYFRIGRILRPHGVRGMVKLEPLTDDPARFDALEEAYLERGNSHEPVRVLQSSMQSATAYVHLEGCDSREAAEALRGLFLCVDRAHAIQLPKGRYFLSDLIGCAVRDTQGREYGTLVDILETGANDVYVVQGEKTLMAPALKKLLLEVDVPNKRILFDAAAVEETCFFAD